jgi:transcription elongation factor Elf1
MKKCSICGRRFRLLAENRYEVEIRPVGLSCLTQRTIYYNAFDCPHCGCQNIIGVVEKTKEAFEGKTMYEVVMESMEKEIEEDN